MPDTQPAPSQRGASRRRATAWGVRLATLVSAVLTTTCGTPVADPPSGAGGSTAVRDPFIAFASDFRGFHSWTSYDVTDDATLAGIHDGSTVTEYINTMPSSGSEEFPLGTIIVKEATGGTIPHELFAMVKRNGGFNSGAPGWEWFDLALLDDGKDGTSIVWHGFGPPIGDTYGGDAKGGCNTCHTACGNDAVCAKPLGLSNFQHD